MTSRAFASLLLAFACVLPGCPKAPPPPPDVEADDSAKVTEQLHEYEEERAAREHPAPACGNGTVDTALERVCAPCLPGRRCPCAYTERAVEDCDGQNLGGKTCRALGFAGGALRCSPACRFDTSACRSALTAMPSDGEGFSTSTAEVPQGAWTALAISQGALGCLASAKAELAFRAYDVRDLARLGPEARKAADGGSFGAAVMAPNDGGFVAAVEQLGEPALALFAVSRDGKFERIGEPLRGLAPRFLVQGDGGYLLGAERLGRGYPVDVVALGAGGAPRGAPATAIDARRQSGGNFAAAAWTGAEYLVASGASTNLPDGGLSLAFVGPAGEVRKTVPVSAPAHDVAVLPSGGGAAQVLFVGNGVLARVAVGADGTTGAPVKIAGGELSRIVAAEVRDAVLYAWVVEGGELHRIRAPLEGTEVSDERVFAGPELAPAAGLLADGKFYVVLATGGGPLLYHLR